MTDVAKAKAIQCCGGYWTSSSNYWRCGNELWPHHYILF